MVFTALSLLFSTKDALTEQLAAASAVASDVTSTILTQRMELENKNKTIEMLQKSLAQQRELTVYHAKEVEKEGQRRLDLQKQEYEATIQRHQCFIDQVRHDWVWSCVLRLPCSVAD